MRELKEIFYSLKRHKLRSITTTVGVSWGIFILVLLIGTGNGLETGVLKLFSGFAQSSIWIVGGISSEDSQRVKQSAKPVTFDLRIVDLLKERFSTIEYITPEVWLTGNNSVNYQGQSGSYSIVGVAEDYFKIKLLKSDEGRFLNEIDIRENRLVAVIGEQVAKSLFKKQSALGKFVEINNEFFKVIGVIAGGTIFSQGEANTILVPIGSLKERFNQGESFNRIGIALSNEADVEQLETHFKLYLSTLLNISSDDDNALFVTSLKKQTNAFKMLFKALKIFLWFIGISLLTSGIIGVTNIMIIIVSERTREIGIRKAIGASSNNILKLILMESVSLTLLAGIIGMCLGMLIIGIGNYALTNFNQDTQFIISKLFVDMPTAVISVILLVIAGAFAGLIPARKAANISPAVAMRE